jgi:hypothetical protein
MTRRNKIASDTQEARLPVEVAAAILHGRRGREETLEPVAKLLLKLVLKKI